MRFLLKITFLIYFVVFKVNAQNERFHHITSKDGLSQSEVYCFLKDSKGFMWFGTVDGLNRFDGYNIKIFNTQKNNPQSLTNNTVRSITEDKMGRIWIGTDDGLNMYSPKTETIYQIVPVSLSSQKLNINSLLIYDEYLYLGTGKGLFRIALYKDFQNKSRASLEKITLDNQNDYKFSIIKLKKAKIGGFWMLRSTNISRIIVESKSKIAITVETPVAKKPSLFDFIEDDSDNLWITSNGGGLIRYNLNDNEETIFNKIETNFGPSSLECSGITTDNRGNIWFGTLDNGLNFISSEQKTKDDIRFKHLKHNSNNPNSLNSNLVRTLFSTLDNIIWIGTIGTGINYYDTQQKSFEHLRINTSTSNGSNFIRAVYATDNQKIWAGTHRNGLYEIDNKTKEIKKLGLGNKSIFYISPFKEDKYFICTNDGLYLAKYFNRKLDLVDYIKTNATFNIVKGENDFYWLASYIGLYRLSVVNSKLIISKHYPLTSSPKGSPENCRVLYYEMGSNELLVGTEGGGLHIITLDENHTMILDKKYKSTGEKGSISNNYIRSIIKDSFNNLWIGTFEGLNKIEKNKISRELYFVQYTEKDGLPNNMINSLVEDDEKCLWIGTNNGLTKFSLPTKTFFNYFESDGIQSNEFSEHSAFKTASGKLLLGGINGVTSFYPSEIIKSKRLPQTTYTDFYINDVRIQPNQMVDENVPLNKGIAIADTINLLPDQNNIGFNFSSMLYPTVKKINYAYKLEGFDDDWQYKDGSSKYVNYTNLDYGKYTFKAKSSNEDGIWEEEASNIYIHIKTPFQYSWYAYLLYFFLIVLVLIFSSYYSIIRYNTKNKLLLEKEHNNKVQSLNKLRTQFFINISHDLRTPLTLIKGPLDSVIKEKDLKNETKEKLLLVKRNVKRLNYLIEQLLDVRRAEKGKLKVKKVEQDIVEFTKKEISHFNYAIHKKGLKYSINCPTERLIVGFDVGMLSKVYFNLISNAIKYTDRGTIDIFIEKVSKEDFKILKNDAKDDVFVKVEVTDTGKGISKSQLKKVFTRFYQEDSTYGKGYGIGLSHSFQLIESHNGFIEAESKENIGTTIRFFIPYTEQLRPKQEQKIVLGEDDIYREEANEIQLNSEQKDKTLLKTVLVVEDNADMRTYIESELKNDYNILQAEDGLRGAEIAEKFDVDIIVSDVMMPNMDGMEFCNYIKNNIKTSHIPVILLTAKTNKKSKYEGIEIGADDYIPKPFEMEYLSLRIKNLLESREKLRNIFQNQQGFSLEPAAVTVNSIDEKFLKDLMEALEKGIPDSEFSVSNLETELGMSHSNFYRKVKSLTGKSGKELLDEMRMKRAKQILLDNNNVRIDEVAYTVGFSNPKYFGKTFKEYFGVSPTEMKKGYYSNND